MARKLTFVAISEANLDAIKAALDANLDTFRGKSTTGSDIDTLELSKGDGIEDLTEAAAFETLTKGYDPASVLLVFEHATAGEVHIRVSTINGSVWFMTPVDEAVMDDVFEVIRSVKGLP
jgi:hypothetical protein